MSVLVDSQTTIACVYPDGRLPARWVRAYLRLKRSVERARLPATVALVPASAVPADVDVVLASADAAAGVASRAPRARVVVAPADHAADAVDALVAELSRGAAPAAVPAAPGAPRATYRGARRIR